MIPKSSSVSRCIQVNLSFFLDSSTLISPSPCTFFCVLSLSFIVLFLLEDPRRGVHIPTVPHVSHKSSAAFMQPQRGWLTAHVSSPSPPLLTPTERPPHTVEANQPSRMDVVSNLSLSQPMLEQLSFHETFPVLFCTSSCSAGHPVSHSPSMQHGFKAFLYTVIDRNFIP